MSAEDEVPLCSVDQLADDARYASLEIHTLPLEAAKLEFLRVDGFWFVKASEGVQEAIESAWRAGTEPCAHRNVTVTSEDEPDLCGRCNHCGVDLDYDPVERNWVEKGGAE